MREKSQSIPLDARDISIIAGMERVSSQRFIKICRSSVSMVYSQKWFSTSTVSSRRSNWGRPREGVSRTACQSWLLESRSGR